MILKLHKTISKLSRIHFQPAFFSTFELPQNIQILEEKAYLASKVIDQITLIDLDQLYSNDPDLLSQPNTSLSDHLKDQSLTQRILAMIEQEKKVKKLSDQSTEQIQKFFTTGVKFDDGVFNQPGMIANQSFSNYECKIMDNAKFTFCPSYWITGGIFRKILSQSSEPLLLCGSYGSSKSVSLMLYSMLSGIIAEYNFKTWGVDSKMKGEIRNVPKLVYFDYKKMNGLISGQMRDSILSQCSGEIPLTRHEELGLDKFYENGQKETLKKIYGERGIQLFFAVDQIDRYLSEYRELWKWEENEASGKDEASGKESERVTNQLEGKSKSNNWQLQVLRKKQQNFANSIKTINRQLGQILFISSRGLASQELLRLKQLLPSKDTSMSQYSFSYYQNLSHEPMIKELVDFYFFLLQTKYHLNLRTLDDPQIKHRLRRKLNQKPIPKPTVYYWREKPNNVKKLTIHEVILKNERTISDCLKQTLVDFLIQYPEKEFLTFASFCKGFDHLKSSYKSKFESNLDVDSLEKLENNLRQFLIDVANLEKHQFTNVLLNKFNKKNQRSKQTNNLLANLIYSAYVEQNVQKQSVSPKQFEIFPKYSPHQGTAFNYFLDNYFIESIQDKTFSQVPFKFYEDFLLKQFVNNFSYLQSQNLVQIKEYLKTKHRSKFIKDFIIGLIRSNKVNLVMNMDNLRTCVIHNFFTKNAHKNSQGSYFSPLGIKYFTQIPQYEIFKVNSDGSNKKIQTSMFRNKKKSQPDYEQIKKMDIGQIRQFNKMMEEERKQLRERRKQAMAVKKQLFKDYSFKNYFLNSFSGQLKRLKSDSTTWQSPETTFLYLPETYYNDSDFPMTLNLELEQNQQKYILKRNFDQSNNYIDFIFATFNFSNPLIPTVTFNAFGIASNLKQRVEKTTRFLEDFSSFADFHEEEFIFSGQILKTLTKIQYFTLEDKDFTTQNIFQVLNWEQQFSDYFILEDLITLQTVYWKVHSKDYAMTKKQQWKKQRQKREKQEEARNQNLRAQSKKDESQTDKKKEQKPKKNRRRVPCFVKKIGMLQIGKNIHFSQTSQNKNSTNQEIYQLWKQLQAIP